MNRHEDTAKKPPVSSVKLIIYSMLGLSLSMLLSLIGAVLVNSEKLPPSLISAMSYSFVFLGVFFSGFLSARKFGKALIYSLTESGICFVFLYILGALLFGRALPKSNVWQVLVSCIGGGLLGGVISTISVPKRKRKPFKLDK